MSEFEIIKESAGTFLIKGLLSQKTVSGLWQQKELFIADKGQLIIDLASVTHSDSSGLAFLTCLKSEAVKSKEELSFINIPIQLQKLIELSHMEEVLDFQLTTTRNKE